MGFNPSEIRNTFQPRYNGYRDKHIACPLKAIRLGRDHRSRRCMVSALNSAPAPRPDASKPHLAWTIGRTQPIPQDSFADQRHGHCFRGRVATPSKLLAIEGPQRRFSMSCSSQLLFGSDCTVVAQGHPAAQLNRTRSHDDPIRDGCITEGPVRRPDVAILVYGNHLDGIARAEPKTWTPTRPPPRFTRLRGVTTVYGTSSAGQVPRYASDHKPSCCRATRRCRTTARLSAPALRARARRLIPT